MEAGVADHVWSLEEIARAGKLRNYLRPRLDRPRAPGLQQRGRRGMLGHAYRVRLSSKTFVSIFRMRSASLEKGKSARPTGSR